MYSDFDEIDFVSLKVIEKNAITKSQRQATERKEELTKVLTRVENIYGEFEKPTNFGREFSSLNPAIFREKTTANGDSTIVECVKDVPALEHLLDSYQSRQKYLQQVTVFIVGYSKMATDRLRLMQEVNQFFVNSETIFDNFIEREDRILNEEALERDKTENAFVNSDYPEDEEYTTSELANNVQQAIQSCQDLTNRLGDLNIEMIDCFAKYAQNKAGNKGRKKMEKALENATNETLKLNEKLTQSLKVISEKDSRIDNLMKQCETKSKEVQKFKAAAESIKKAAMESEKLKEQLSAKEAQILQLQSELAQSQMKLDQTKTLDAAQRANAEEIALEFQDKYKNLEKVLEAQKIEFEETKRNLKRQHETEMKQLHADNENSFQQIRIEHQQEIQQLKELNECKQLTVLKSNTKMSSEFDENAIALHWSEPEEDDNKPSRRSLSSLSRNFSDILSSPPGDLSPINNGSNSASDNEKKKSTSNSGSPSRFGSEKNGSRQPTTSGRSSGKDVLTFSDAPDLDNEEFWSSVPRSHLLGRFFQYRQLSMASMSNLLDQHEKLQGKSTRQIYSLKSQHQQHQQIWDRERELLIEAVRNTEKDRKDAQKYADLAMEEMENIVTSLKVDKNQKLDGTGEILEETDETKLIEKVDQIKEYLKTNDLLKDPIGKMIGDLRKMCQLFQERSRISVPKYVTMVDLRKSEELKQNLMANATQTEDENYRLISRIGSHGSILDEEKDIMFPEEIDSDKSTRSVAISASPTLVRIAFNDYWKSSNNSPIEKTGVSAQDLEVPSEMEDVQDRTGLTLIQHPVVTDYLHSYDQILTFKEQFLAMLEELDKIDLREVLNLKELSPVSIRSQNRITPQIEEIGKSIEKILQMSLQILEHMLLPRKKIESKTNKEVKSRLSPTKGKQPIPSEKTTKVREMRSLQEDCRQMKLLIKALQQSYQSKFNLLNQSMLKLKQMLSVLHKQCDDRFAVHDEVHIQNLEIRTDVTNTNPADNLQHQPPLDYDSISILFTRRDSERNIGRIQNAILENGFPETLYKEAVEKMAQYVEIPAKQLYILVRKYLHRDAMERISYAVKKNQNFTADTFKILNRMEYTTEKKQQRYKDIQDHLRNERLIRAKALTETLEKVENTCSIFMIKPVLNYKTKGILVQLIDSKNLINKTTRFNQNYWEKKHENNKINYQKEQQKLSEAAVENKFSSFSQIWNPESSIDNMENDYNSIFESRLLEIDTNRMLLPLNNVSVPYTNEGIYGKESILPPQIAVRSYVAVAHPTLVDIDQSPNNSKPSSRVATATETNAKSRMSRDLSKHIPLPPITSLEINNHEVDVKINKENHVENTI